MSTVIRRLAVAALLGGLVFLMAKAAAFKFSDLFFIHVASMSVAFLGLMPEVIGFAAKMKVAKTKKDKDSILDMHAMTAFLCKLFALVGLVAIWVFKEDKGYPHVSADGSLHAQFGISAGAALFVQVVLGVLQNKAFQFSASARDTLKKIHGMCSFALALLAAGAFFLGMQTRYAEGLIPDQVLRYVIGITVLANGLWAAFS